MYVEKLVSSCQFIFNSVLKPLSVAFALAVALRYWGRVVSVVLRV